MRKLVLVMVVAFFALSVVGQTKTATANAFNVSATRTPIRSATATGGYVVITNGAPFRARISSHRSASATVTATQFYSTSPISALLQL
jgi:hypothetical protein